MLQRFLHWFLQKIFWNYTKPKKKKQTFPTFSTTFSVRNERNNLTTQKSLKPIRMKPCVRAVISSECFRFPPSWSHLSLRARFFYLFISVWYTCSCSHLALIVFPCLCGLSVAKEALKRSFFRMGIYCNRREMCAKKLLCYFNFNWQAFLCVLLSSASNWWSADVSLPPSMMTRERLL